MLPNFTIDCDDTPITLDDGRFRFFLDSVYAPNDDLGDWWMDLGWVDFPA